jgi:hypothetical protein
VARTLVAKVLRNFIVADLFQFGSPICARHAPRFVTERDGLNTIFN